MREEDLDERTHVITVSGEIHVSTAAEFQRRLDAAIARGKTAVGLDLSETAFLDSTGLSVIPTGRRRATRQRGRMTLVCPTPTVLRLSEIPRLTSTFDIHETRDDAVRAARAGYVATADGS